MPLPREAVDGSNRLSLDKNKLASVWTSITRGSTTVSRTKLKFNYGRNEFRWRN